MMHNQVILKSPCDKCSGTGGRWEYEPGLYPGEDWQWLPCKICAGSRFAEKTYLTSELESLAERLLKGCDWDIDYSDCQASRQREDAKHILICQILATINRQTAIELWEKYSPGCLPTYLQA